MYGRPMYLRLTGAFQFLVPREADISPKEAKKTKTTRTIPRSTEAVQVGRSLAVLALAWVKQEGQLRVRQREQLRRALAAAAEILEWATISEDRLDITADDVLKLTKNGTQAIAKDLADELAAKKTEMSQLKKSAATIAKLATKGDFSDPIEVSYTHTAREATSGLVTRVETATLLEPQEALDTAATIEKKTESWGKLREQMIEDLKQKQRRLEEMKASMSEFVEASKRILVEVFATFH